MTVVPSSRVTASHDPAVSRVNSTDAELFSDTWSSPRERKHTGRILTTRTPMTAESTIARKSFIPAMVLTQMALLRCKRRGARSITAAARSSGERRE
jgi:hypothetical protein